MTAIGDVAKQLGVSTHTLRYYEKIELLPPVAKSSGGRRNYSKSDIERIRFIKSAQRMDFTLAQIKTLLELDRSSQRQKQQVQGIVADKLVQIEEHLNELISLKGTLNSMLSQCRNSQEDQDCPILQGIKHNSV